MAMTMGRREYSDAEMMRMQRDAEERVRDMQSRARITVENDNLTSTQQRNRNWNNGGGMRRPNNGNNRRPTPEPQQPQPSNIPPPVAEAPTPEENCEEPKKTTTIIEDVMGALSLDEDYLLIVGLMLILINQRADTTLILALAYLLI